MSYMAPNVGRDPPFEDFCCCIAFQIDADGRPGQESIVGHVQEAYI